VGSVAIFLKRPRVEHVITGSQNDGAYFALAYGFRREQKVDGAWWTHLLAVIAGDVIWRVVQTVCHVNEVCAGN